MRLLFASNLPPDPTLGAAYCDLATIAALRDLGHDVDELWEAASPRRIRHGNLHQLLELPGAYARAIDERCLKREYDAIQVSQPHAFLAARHHRRLRRHGVFVNRSHGWEPRVREVLRPFGDDPLERKPLWRRWASDLLWALLRRHNTGVLLESDGLVVGCRADRDHALGSARLAAERVLVLHPGVDPDFLAPAAEYTWQRSRRLLYVGQFARFKAPGDVARAASRLLSWDASLSMTWVCQARHHADARALLEAGIRERVTFEDWRDRRSLRDLMDRHGLLLFPSLYEGFGQVFLEAMARGLCVVATAVGGVAEVIQDGLDGHCVAPRDVEALTARAAGLLREPASMAAMSAAARRSAESRTWKAAALALSAFLENLEPRDTSRGKSVAARAV